MIKAKILEFMEKGKTTLARVEVDNGQNQVVVPVPLKEGMTEDDFLAEAKKMAVNRFAALDNPAPGTTLEDAQAEILAARAAVSDIKATLESKINKKIDVS